MRTAFRAALTAAAITTTATAALADPVSVPERLMGDLQADLDLADFQAAGIVGNLARETGNFQFLRELNPLVPGSRGGIGYAQWTGPRHDTFLEFVGDADPMRYEVNYAFLIEELEGPYVRVLDRLRETETLGEATEVFMRGYLAPHPRYLHLDERIAFASAYLEGDFSGAGCESVHRVFEAGNVEVLQECPRALAEIRPKPRPGSELTQTAALTPETRPRARPDRLAETSREPAGDVTITLGPVEVRSPFTGSGSKRPEPS
jgi:hypothetical protein